MIDVETPDLNALRAWRDTVLKLLPQVEAKLRAADEAELAAARAHVAQIEARMNIKPAVVSRTPERTPNPLDETDAGNGVGVTREPETDAESFRAELLDLRNHNLARRRRRA